MTLQKALRTYQEGRTMNDWNFFFMWSRAFKCSVRTYSHGPDLNQRLSRHHHVGLQHDWL